MSLSRDQDGSKEGTVKAKEGTAKEKEGTAKVKEETANTWNGIVKDENAKEQPFVWMNDEVELLLRVTHEFKVKKTAENVDW